MMHKMDKNSVLLIVLTVLKKQQSIMTPYYNNVQQKPYTHTPHHLRLEIAHTCTRPLTRFRPSHRKGCYPWCAGSGRDGTAVQSCFVRIVSTWPFLISNRRCTVWRTSSQVAQEATSYPNEDEDTK